MMELPKTMIVKTAISMMICRMVSPSVCLSHAGPAHCNSGSPPHLPCGQRTTRHRSEQASSPQLWVAVGWWWAGKGLVRGSRWACARAEQSCVCVVGEGEAEGEAEAEAEGEA